MRFVVELFLKGMTDERLFPCIDGMVVCEKQLALLVKAAAIQASQSLQRECKKG